MKPYFNFVIPIIIAGPASAIEPPADDFMPPPVRRAAPEKGDPAAEAPAAKQESGFLGLSTSEVPDLLKEHLNLKDGEGVVVRALQPDGPAAKAGLTQHDIITRVADQPVASQAELSTLIMARKPEEMVKLDIIHKGKPGQLEVTLGARPDGGLAGEPRPLDRLKMEGMPQEQADHLRGMIEKQLQAFEDPEAMDREAFPLNKTMRELQMRMGQAFENGADGQVTGAATFRLKDNDGSVEIKSIDGGKEVTLRDPRDKVTWSGPWDTEQDKAAAPKEVRERIENLNMDESFAGNGLRFNFLPKPGAVPLPADPEAEEP